MSGVIGTLLIAASTGLCVPPPASVHPNSIHPNSIHPEAATQATPAPAGQPAPLSGPRLETPAASITLVETDYNGKVRRVEATPEEAAMKMITLEPADRARVDQVFADRARVMDGIIRDNLLLLNQIDTASKAGRKLETLVLLMDLYGKFQPLRDRGVLHDQVEATLPEPARPEFNRLVGGYWDAIIDEGRRLPKADGKPPARMEIVLGERFEIFGREIERSFKRYEMTAVEDVLDKLVRGLELSADQQRSVEPIVDRLAQAIRAEAPEKERGLIVVQLTAFLTADQTAKLIEAFNKLGR